MKKLSRLIWPLSIVLLLIVACEKDFIVKDIKNKSITIISPVDNLKTTKNVVNFWWEELDGAEKYTIQVVSPSFTAVSSIAIDTNVTGTKANITLKPGTYQWRIRATNAGGSTAFQTFNLIVDTTSNLSGQLVSAIQPMAGFITRNRTINFKWNSLNAATQYQIQIFNNSNGLVKDTTTANTFFNYTFPNATTGYTWKTRALNNFSISQYNPASSFTIDVTPPSAPTLSAPAMGATATLTNELQWVRQTSTSILDARYDSVQIATDSLFTSIFSNTKVRAQKIAINSVNSPPSVQNINYWWRVYSVDSAGNVSGPSTPQRKFKLTP